MSGHYQPLPEAHRAGVSNVGAIFRSNALAFGDHVAIVDGDRTFTYSQLDARTNQLAQALMAKGIAPGERIAILANNCAEYFEVELAAAKCGAILAALNWRLGDRELQHCIDLVSPKLIITTVDLNDNLDRLSLEGIPRVLLGGPYEALLSRAEPIFPDLALDAEAGFVILYTSGTTGLPKGALISHRAMVARGLMFAAELGMPRHDHFIAWAPMFHMASTDQGLAYLMRGGTVHMIDGFLPDRIIDVLERHEMGWFLMVPGMVAEFSAALRARNAAVKGLGCIGAMADLIPREHIAEATELMQAPFLNTFGATETGLAPATSSVIPIGAAPERLPKRQSAFCDVRLVDPDDNEVPIGQPGEVSIAGPTLFSGYWENDQVNRKDFRGGRFHMGDVLRRNADGTLDYVDRVKYMIKSGGENIYPAEIEQVVEADPRVETAVVVRKPHERWGEVPVLLVVPQDNSLEVGDLMAVCDRDLSRYKRPREVHFIEDADLPRSTTGKIQRHILEQQLPE
ncbi:MAG: AMP-binding protein [Pseudomonadota bacterium]